MIALGYFLAVLIGLSLGLLGGGGSILTVPVLVYVFGYQVKEAVPMSLVVVGITSLVGVVRHQRAGNVLWGAAAPFAVAATAGAFAGARAATLITGRLQLQLFAVLVLVAAVSMFFGPALWRGVRRPVGPRPWPLVAGLGALVGALTGLLGIGGGFLYVPALSLLGGLEMKPAIGTSLVLIVVSCVAGFVGHLSATAVPWEPVAIFTALAVLGVFAGSALCRYVAQERLRRGFAVFLLFMGILVFLRPR